MRSPGGRRPSVAGISDLNGIAIMPAVDALRLSTLPSTFALLQSSVSKCAASSLIDGFRFALPILGFGGFPGWLNLNADASGARGGM
jgi:hypothetical protein